MDNIKDLLLDELHDILSSEEQIVKALPKMAAAAQSPNLKKAFESHLKETKGQIQRLDKVFHLLKVKPKKKFCKATKGLIEECQEVLKDMKKASTVRDAALISKAQRVEHYEISAYGTVRTFAKELGLPVIAKLLQTTLNEEAGADKKLTKIAEGGLVRSGINIQALPAVKSPAKKIATVKKLKKISTVKKRVIVKKIPKKSVSSKRK